MTRASRMRVIVCGLVGLVWLAGEPAAAGSCEDAIARAEYEHRIPGGLLRAMGIVEAGRSDGVIHPWSLNVEGEPHLVRSRGEAEQLARRAAVSGKSFDGGCIQVNWRWHGHAFEKPEHLVDPLRNARYAAALLAEERQRRGNWTEAVKNYHSGNADRQRDYVCKVWRTYARLQGKRPAPDPYCVTEAAAPTSETAPGGNPGSRRSWLRPATLPKSRSTLARPRRRSRRSRRRAGMASLPHHRSRRLRGPILFRRRSPLLRPLARQFNPHREPGPNGRRSSRPTI